jgi:hypothetical protein
MCLEAERTLLNMTVTLETTMPRSAASIEKSKALEIRVHPEGRHLVSGQMVRVLQLSVQDWKLTCTHSRPGRAVLLAS